MVLIMGMAQDSFCNLSAEDKAFGSQTGVLNSVGLTSHTIVRVWNKLHV